MDLRLILAQRALYGLRPCGYMAALYLKQQVRGKHHEKAAFLFTRRAVRVRTVMMKHLRKVRDQVHHMLTTVSKSYTYVYISASGYRFVMCDIYHCRMMTWVQLHLHTRRHWGPLPCLRTLPSSLCSCRFSFVSHVPGVASEI